MGNLTNEQREELKRKVQEEKVRRVQKRLSTKACLTAPILLIYGFGWGHLRGASARDAIVYGIVAGVINILVAVWVYRDAKRRPMRAFAWALLTFFLMPAALVLYLLETQEEPPVPRVE